MTTMPGHTLLLRPPGLKDYDSVSWRDSMRASRVVREVLQHTLQPVALRAATMVLGLNRQPTTNAVTLTASLSTTLIAKSRLCYVLPLVSYPSNPRAVPTLVPLNS